MFQIAEGMFMSAVNKLVEEIDKEQGNRFKPCLFVVGMIIMIALIIAGISYYQATHFNAQITINGTKVGGLTADQVLE